MADKDLGVDLTNCDREPIHQLGSIQPIGMLIAVTSDWIIARAANAPAIIDTPDLDLIGLPLRELCDDEAIHTLRNRLTLLHGPDAVERLFGIALLRDRSTLFDCALHMSAGHIVIEIEPSADTDHADPSSLIRSMMGRLDHSADMRGFFREGARQVRAITGFDRVMVYRFDRDGSGEVVAEAARAGIGSFLDLRYPASDIPRQARALYLRMPFRIIADIDAPPAPIVPALDEAGEPLDLSLSVLRAVSPIHIEYLRNMGVAASMSISIIVGGQLWGLFACHHYSPRCPSFDRRTVAELFGSMFALKLESRERRETADYEMRARAAGDRLLSAMAGDAALIDDPAWIGSMISETVPCDGVAIWLDGRMALSGKTPPASAIPTLVRRLNAMAASRAYSTDSIYKLMPEAEAYAADASGVLAIPISRSPRDYVMLFREEQIRTVKWAGDPHKPATLGPNGARLTPRESFAAWSQEVRCRSLPFTDAEMRVAETLRASLIEVVLRLSEEAQGERRRASERQELLIAELNHRVRNILALIRGLVRQSRSPGMSAEDYIRLLDGRIGALARAHDQITQDNWGPARLAPLIETEAAAFLAGKGERVEAKGPAVLLLPAAFTTLALVIHELVTNSAKYGSLSDSGTVSVEWSFDGDGNLLIDWRETGGPAVKAPTRQGFGTTIIQRSIPYDLGGKADVNYRVTGLEAHFCVPARHVVPGETAVGRPSPVTGASAGSAKEQQPTVIEGSVLLVEDSLIIAMDAEDILTQLGAARVTTVANLAEAFAEIDRGLPDLAILDINLGSETSLPVAQKLRAAGVRFAFATGYGDQLVLPDDLADTPVVSKPYTLASLRALFER